MREPSVYIACLRAIPDKSAALRAYVEDVVRTFDMCIDVTPGSESRLQRRLWNELSAREQALIRRLVEGLR